MPSLEVIRTILVGMVMGAAEVVPGVSGGTIAFISGIYEKLLNSIKQFTPYILVRLKDDGIPTVWREVDANFLLMLFGGMGISIILFAGGLNYLLENQPIAIWSFFFGLVIASAILVASQISSLGIESTLGISLGVAIGVVLTHVAPVNLEPSPLTLFIGGSIAICAWILPGLSGSFILLILGLYAFVIDAIKSFDLLNLMYLGLGCAMGIVAFSQVLSRTFARYRNLTLSVLTGFMLGSLMKLWPWKQTTSYQIKADGSQLPLVQEPVLPGTYVLLTGDEPQVALALASAVSGLLIVAAINWLAKKKVHDPDQA